MIELEGFNHCVCRGDKKPVEMCAGELQVREKGKSLKLIPKKGEEAVAINLDPCVIRNGQSTCDALFLLKAPHRKYMIPVELYRVLVKMRSI